MNDTLTSRDSFAAIRNRYQQHLRQQDSKDRCTQLYYVAATGRIKAEREGLPDLAASWSRREEHWGTLQQQDPYLPGAPDVPAEDGRFVPGKGSDQ